MAIEPDQEICQSQEPISQAPEPKMTPQDILCAILERIDKAKEEQCLEYTLPTEEADLVLQLLRANANFERRLTLSALWDICITSTNTSC